VKACCNVCAGPWNEGGYWSGRATRERHLWEDTRIHFVTATVSGSLELLTPYPLGSFFFEQTITASLGGGIANGTLTTKEL
jgi:hypothetical protein